MIHTDDTCPECRGLKRIPAPGGTSVKNGVLVHDLVHRQRRCPTCLGIGKQPILEPSSAPSPNAAPHEHAEAEEAAYLEETSNG